jgi:K+-sensing histidine kinase KdpD
MMFLNYLMPDFLAGTARPEWGFANPMEVFLQMLPGYLEQALIRQVELVFDPDGLLPDMPSVWLERASFQRLCHCLTWNAIKYSYHGIRERGHMKWRTVRIRCKPRHDERSQNCVISIRNYGLGIEPDELPHICEPTYRGRHARREVQVGTGLGLYDAACIVRAHGGRLSITSRPVHESTYLTTVRIVLPRQRRKEEAQHAAAQSVMD